MREDSTVLAGDKRHSPCLGEVAERLLRGCTKRPCLLQNSSHFDAFTHPSAFPPVVSSLSARQNRGHLVSVPGSRPAGCEGKRPTEER